MAAPERLADVLHVQLHIMPQRVERLVAEQVFDVIHECNNIQDGVNDFFNNYRKTMCYWKFAVGNGRKVSVFVAPDYAAPAELEDLLVGFLQRRQP